MRLCVIVFACLLFAAPARASVQDTAPDADPPVTDGTVEAVVRDGSTLYIGGDFAYVGRRTSLARLGADGRSTGTFPRVTDGTVEALLDDGAGGWFVGGSFATIGDVDVPRLAHVLADGTVDAAFRPAPDGEVRALAQRGGTLYAGGSFGLALLDPADGSSTATVATDGAVEALTATGDAVLAGGAFTMIGGQARNHVAALDSAVPTAWNPNADGTVRALAADGADVYLGGDFTHVAGADRTRLAAVDATTGAVRAFSAVPGDRIRDIEVDADHVYVAGDFGSVNGSVEGGFAQLDRATGTVQYVDANNYGPVYDLVLDGGRLYLGGRPWQDWPPPVDVPEAIGAIDLTTGRLAYVAPHAGGAVHALAVRGGDVFAGGTFDSAGGEQHARLAAIDLDTGAPTAWDPDADDTVTALAVHDGTLYAGGRFTHVAGATRGRAAAFDTATGALSAFDARADAAIGDLVAADAGVFVAGGFSTAGGAARSRLAALDPGTGDAREGWDPAPNGTVSAIALQDGTLYAGGTFTMLAGAARHRLGAVDAGTGTVTAFDPALYNTSGEPPTVSAIVPSGGATVFVAGRFRTAGGQTRLSAAELDGGSGAATEWFAGWAPPDDVAALAVSRARVWLGGQLDGFGSAEPLAVLEEHDRHTGALVGWLPRTEGSIRALAAGSGGLIAAGEFTAIGSAPHRNLATWSPAPELLASPHVTGGAALTCAPGEWDGQPTGYSFTWLRDGDAIATGDQYAVVPADDGAELRCRVTARTRGGSATALSAPAGSADPPATVSGPEITGTVAYEATVTCDPGTWTGGPAFAFRWLRDGVPITDADAAQHTLADADAGTEISCRVTAENTGGSATAESPAIAVAPAPALLTPPQVTGTDELECTAGTWSGSPTGFSWRWIDADGDEVSTAATFVVRPEDAGTTVWCEVTARNAGGVSTTTAPIWIALAPPVSTVAPKILGTPRSGVPLTCTQGTWTGMQWLVLTRWLRDGVQVAVGAHWTPGAADIGHSVRCEVTVSNGRQSTALSAPVTITAVPVAPVAPKPPVVKPAPPAAATVQLARTAVVRRGRAVVARIICPAGRGACTGTVTVRAGVKRLGAATVSVPPGRGVDVRVRVRRPQRTVRARVVAVIDGRTVQQALKLKPR